MTNEFYKQLINQSPIGYAYHKIICDQNEQPIDYEFIDVNLAFEQLTGLKRVDILGKKITEILPNILMDDFNWIECYGDIALNGTQKEFEQFCGRLCCYINGNRYLAGFQ